MRPKGAATSVQMAWNAFLGISDLLFLKLIHMRSLGMVLAVFGPKLCPWQRFVNQLNNLVDFAVFRTPMELRDCNVCNVCCRRAVCSCQGAMHWSWTKETSQIFHSFEFAMRGAFFLYVKGAFPARMLKV